MSDTERSLEARISELESTIAMLRDDNAAPAMATPATEEPRFGRRRLLRLAAAAAGGGVAAPLLLSQGAQATNGCSLIIGTFNTSSANGSALSTTLFQQLDSHSNNTHFTVKHHSSDNTGESAFGLVADSASIWGIGGANQAGIYGYSGGIFGTGVLGASDHGWGVKGATLTGVDMIASGTGRILQIGVGSCGPPSFSSGSWEQVRDNFGAMYAGMGSNGWVPMLFGGDNKGIFEKVITTQPTLQASDGATWQLMDTNLKVSFTPVVMCNALCTGNADLWTWVAGYNQDIAIGISGGTFGAGTSTTPGTVVSWKESGGFAGTFSPNAAFVQGIVRNLLPTASYTIGLYWKTNVANGAGGRATPSKISAGAGQSPTFSPTRLVVQLIPKG